MEIWTRKVGDDSLYLKCEDGNEHKKYAVTIMIGGRNGGHVLKNLSKIFNIFLTLLNCAIKYKVTGKRINREAGYGLEIPIQCNFFGPEKAVVWPEKGVKKVINSVEKRTKNCTK